MSQQKGRRIIINNVKKSMAIPNNNSGNMNKSQFLKQPLHDSLAPRKDTQYQQKISKLLDEQSAYKQKYEEALIKVRFLTQKLSSYGGLHTLPENITNQISETDQKIKKLEDLLYFKRSKQMSKLKKRIMKFLETLQYQISEQDLNKIQDEVEIILFLIDVFTDKYNEIMSEKQQIDQLVDELQKDTIFNRQALQQEATLYKIQNQRLTKYLRETQLELIHVKRLTMTKQQDFNRYQSNQNIQHFPTSNIPHEYSSYIEQIRKIQTQSQRLRIQLQKTNNEKKSLEFQISLLKRRNEQDQSSLSAQHEKIVALKQELEYAHKQQNKWRERYTIMEKQKDQRIKILQKQLNAANKFKTQESDSMAKKNRITFGRQNYIEEEDNQQYYDLT